MGRRGAGYNPKNRFEKIEFVPDEPPALSGTQYLVDSSKSIISYNDSPDVGFEASINPYRGCSHGCVYCYARPTHEYLGFSAGLDFESKIMVKEDAAQLLREELSSPRWKPQVIAVSGATDAYQPVEREKQITRGCLRVLAEFRNPVVVVTKNHLVTRDIDLLAELAKVRAAAVFVSVTSLDEALARVMEPRASAPRLRLRAIRELAQAGIPVGTLVAPVVPALTDHEIPSIVEAVTREGAQFAGYVMLRLPYAVSPIFEEWLSRNFPDRKDKVLHRIREIREGRLNDPRFGSRMVGAGVFAEQVSRMFEVACRKARLPGRSPELSTASFRRPQLELF